MAKGKKSKKRKETVPDGYPIGTRHEEAVNAVAQAREEHPPRQLLFTISEEDWESLGEQPRRILGEILPKFIDGFIEANQHYGPQNANALGLAGQFSDIWRKIKPLHRALWKGEKLTREPADRICEDLIGHSLLTIDMIRQGVDRRGEGLTL